MSLQQSCERLNRLTEMTTIIKERIPISGDLKSKVRQLMEYAGWQEGRNVDISIAEKYYADHGVPMMKTTQRFYRKYFGLCCEWYLEPDFDRMT